MYVCVKQTKLTVCAYFIASDVAVGHAGRRFRRRGDTSIPVVDLPLEVAVVARDELL